MNRRMLIMGLTAVLILILAACGGTTAPAATGAETAVEEAMPAASVDVDSETMEDESQSDDTAPEAGMEAEAGLDGEAGMDGESHEGDMDGDDDMEGSMDADAAAGEMDSAEDMGESAMRPAWQTVALTNAATGESFALGDFAGKTVFVEPMATWCTNCRQQLNNVAQARQSAGGDVVFVALSLETTLDPADLARYQQDNGFDWTFAVMSEELLQGLADEFGRSITSAPSTPHFIIRPDGSFTELSTGIDSPDELLAMLAAAGS